MRYLLDSNLNVTSVDSGVEYRAAGHRRTERLFYMASYCVIWNDTGMHVIKNRFDTNPVLVFVAVVKYVSDHTNVSA